MTIGRRVELPAWIGIAGISVMGAAVVWSAAVHRPSIHVDPELPFLAGSLAFGLAYFVVRLKPCLTGRPETRALALAAAMCATAGICINVE